MGVAVADVLGERATKGGELAETVGVCFNNKLFGISQEGVRVEIWHSVEQVEDAVNSIFWELLGLTINVKVDEFLTE